MVIFLADGFRNIKMTVAYEGTHYAGFQRQADTVPTIQGTLEAAILKITRESINIIGAGRTDAGVHAKGQVVNFRTFSQIPVDRLLYALNSILPYDILVKDTALVDNAFHARFDAKGKTYSYHIYTGPLRPIFNRHTVYYYRYPLKPELMQQAAELLKGKRDFKCFQAAGSSVKTTVRTIQHIEIQCQERDLILRIQADGFLYHMVRNIAGTLIEVGNGRISMERFQEVIAGTERMDAGPTAPARGLCLEEVQY